MPSGNLPGPYEIEFLITGWTSPARDHLFRANVVVTGSPAIGTAATAIDVQKTSGATAKLNVVANQIWEFLRLFNNTAITCSGYTLWRYVTGTHAKDFISSGAVTNPACSGTGGAAAGQLTQTYRSANGGIMKVVILESNQLGNNRVTLVPNAAGNPSQKLAAYILSADNVFISRDDAYPVNALRDSRGENEAIWRQVFR